MTRPRIVPWMIATGVVVLGLVLASACVGRTTIPVGDVVRAALARLSLRAPLQEPLQTIIELRLWRALTAAGVGAALSLAGALLQGLFRNPLAAPSLIGVTGGASLGATVAILLVGGYAPNLAIQSHAIAPTLLIPLLAFLGAALVTAVVVTFAARAGRVSTPTLLLFGIAINLCVNGAFAALQSWMLRDWEVSRAIMAWTFGVLEDRDVAHVITVWIGALASAAVIPFVAFELDLFQGGEEDAAALGVRVVRVKVACLIAAALAASAAVAVAGQIAFIGLLVPHLVRLRFGTRHARVLPLSFACGAAFLLIVDLGQRLLIGEGKLQPGVTMALVGGPFFLWLLVRNRREISAW